MSTLAVVGSRTFRNYEILRHKLDDESGKTPFSVIVSGGAEGADTLAAQYAREHNITLLELRPDPSKGKYGPLIRNTDIIKRADRVIAFWDGQSTGTLDSIKKARRMNKPLIIVAV